MPRECVAPDTKILTLKVDLLDIKPSIWRRFEIAEHMTLGDLHYVLQLVMGWTNSHLHEFHIGVLHYGMILEDDFEIEPIIDEDEVKLSSVLKRAGTTFIYVYDFGDNWEHRIKVEQIAPAEPDVRYPRCLAGERQAPPEDCGSISGYERLLAVLQDPSHEDYEDLKMWVGEGYDPEYFNLDETNLELEDIELLREIAESDEGI